MRENGCERIVTKLQAVSRAREEGLSCPNALLAAYMEELGADCPAAVQLAEALPKMLGEPELCDVFAVTLAIIVQLTGFNHNYAEIVDRLRREYGTSVCGSGGKEAPLCTQRTKDCVLMIQWARETAKRSRENPLEASTQ